MFEGSRVDAAKYLDISDRTLRTYISRIPELHKWKEIIPPSNGRGSHIQSKIDNFLIENIVCEDDKVQMIEDLFNASLTSFEYKLASKDVRKKIVEELEKHLKTLL